MDLDWVSSYYKRFMDSGVYDIYDGPNYVDRQGFVGGLDAGFYCNIDYIYSDDTNNVSAIHVETQLHEGWYLDADQPLQRFVD